MDLSIREAAALLGRSSRTVRAQAARGELPAVKRNGRWLIPRDQLPLTEAQRRSLQGKAEAVRQTVEAALPSRLARTPGQRSRSIADLDAFRSGARLLTELRAASPEVLPSAVLGRVTTLLEQALLDLAEAIQQFDRELKLAASNRSRAGLRPRLGAVPPPRQLAPRLAGLPHLPRGVLAPRPGPPLPLYYMVPLPLFLLAAWLCPPDSWALLGVSIGAAAVAGGVYAVRFWRPLRGLFGPGSQGAAPESRP